MQKVWKVERCCLMHSNATTKTNNDIRLFLLCLTWFAFRIDSRNKPDVLQNHNVCFFSYSIQRNQHVIFFYIVFILKTFSIIHCCSLKLENWCQKRLLLQMFEDVKPWKSTYTNVARWDIFVIARPVKVWTAQHKNNC